MTLDEAERAIGETVVYTPYGGGRPEVGVIREVRSRWVFVAYTKDTAAAPDGRSPAKATMPQDLQLYEELAG